MFKGSRIAAVSVINDLVSDQRVKKTCLALQDSGYQVLLIGRVLPDSPPLNNYPVKTWRMKLLFTSGPFFYFFFNLRLFFKLLVTRSQLLYANDLDTLLPNYLVSKIKSVPLIYDSHELFCEVPELVKTPVKRMIWLSLEKMLLPRIGFNITVNQSIASYFEQKYGRHFSVVRNISDPETIVDCTRAKLDLPQDKQIIILQGAGINIDRGAEELVEAMKKLPQVLLLIVGRGDVWDFLGDKISRELITNVRMIKRLPRNELLCYTSVSDLGISIDKNTNPNYYYSLPNKIFDYIHAGVPVLASRLPEIEKVVTEYGVGEFIESHDPQHIADRIRQLLDSPKLQEYRKNCSAATAELNWARERLKLLEVIKQASSVSASPL